MRRKVSKCYFQDPALNQKFHSIEQAIDGLGVNWKNVIIVAKSGGDYKDIQKAIDKAYSKTPSATNRFAIFIMPGIYEEDLTYREYVDLVSFSGAKVKGKTVTLADNTLTYNLEFEHTPVTTSTVTSYCTESSTMDADNPNTNYNNTSSVSPGNVGFRCASAATKQQAILDFDFSSCPDNAPLTAKLCLNVVEVQASGETGKCSFKTALRETIPAQVTHTEWSTGNSWTSAGANSLNNDYRGIATFATNPSATGVVEIDLLQTATIGTYSIPELIDGTVKKLILRPHVVASGVTYCFFSPASHANLPYIVTTHGASASTFISLASGSCILKNVNITGDSSLTNAISNAGTELSIYESFIYGVNKGVISATSGTTIIHGTKIDATTSDIEHTGSGAAYSLLNRLQGAGNSLVRSAGTVYSLMDEYGATSGTITLLGNADKVDGYDAGNASGNVAVSNTALCVDLNADLLDGQHGSYYSSRKMTVTTPLSYPYTVLATDCYIEASASGGTVSVTLPAAAANSGMWYVIRKADSTGTVNVTDGTDTYSLDVLDMTVSVVSNGTTWEVF